MPSSSGSKKNGENASPNITEEGPISDIVLDSFEAELEEEAILIFQKCYDQLFNNKFSLSTETLRTFFESEFEINIQIDVLNEKQNEHNQKHGRSPGGTASFRHTKGYLQNTARLLDISIRALENRENKELMHHHEECTDTFLFGCMCNSVDRQEIRLTKQNHQTRDYILKSINFVRDLYEE